MSCPSDTVRKRVEAVLDMAITTVSSLAESFMTGVSMTPEDADPKQEKFTLPDEHAAPETVEDNMTVDSADVPS